MNPPALLCLLLLAIFGLTSLLLSGLLAVAWRWGGLNHIAEGSPAADLLCLRLLPATGAMLVCLGVVLPAFLSYEPHREQEGPGAALIALASLALLSIFHGAWRAWRASAAARALLTVCEQPPLRRDKPRAAVHIVDIGRPLVAVVGAWRPKILAARSVKAACEPYEFRQVLAHEAAHLAARDNLKRLLLVAAPDPLAWSSAGRAMCAGWQAAAEREADRRATGDNPRRRLALAAALVKVARLVAAGEGSQPAVGLSAAADDVPARVRLLLKPPAPPPRPILLYAGLIAAVVMPLLAWPGYALLHGALELLVGFGR